MSHEIVVCFGTHGGPIGVLGLASEKPSDTLIVFLSAGLLPRTGPYRLHVTAGRRLSNIGFDHLRLDQGNLGDSRERLEPDSSLERAFLDVQITLDHLSREYEYKNFVLVGLCAGAYTALLYASRDPRVRGMVLLDLPIGPSLGFYWRKFLKLFSPRRWQIIFKRYIRRLRLPQVYSPYLANPPSNSLTRLEIMNALQDHIHHNRKILWLYTGNSPFPFNSEKQYSEMFGDLIDANQEWIQCEWRPRASHLYSFTEDRDDLISTISNWVLHNFSKQSK